MATLTLLLLSGGGHTGSNVMGALASRRTGLHLVTTSDRPDEPALFRFDAAYIAPRLADDVAGFARGKYKGVFNLVDSACTNPYRPFSNRTYAPWHCASCVV